MNITRTLFFIACLSISVVACKTIQEAPKTETVAVVKPVLDCSSSALTYSAIKPILEKHCNSCHSDGGAGGYDFLVFTHVTKAGANGELLGTIKHERGFPNMPAQAAQLDQASIDLIECWIKNGMKE